MYDAELLTTNFPKV